MSRVPPSARGAIHGQDSRGGAAVCGVRGQLETRGAACAVARGAGRGFRPAAGKRARAAAGEDEDASRAPQRAKVGARAAGGAGNKWSGKVPVLFGPHHDPGAPESHEVRTGEGGSSTGRGAERREGKGGILASSPSGLNPSNALERDEKASKTSLCPALSGPSMDDTPVIPCNQPTQEWAILQFASRFPGNRRIGKRVPNPQPRHTRIRHQTQARLRGAREPSGMAAFSEASPSSAPLPKTPPSQLRPRCIPARAGGGVGGPRFLR